MEESKVQAQSLSLAPVQEFLALEEQRWQKEFPNENGWAIFTGKVPLRAVIKFLIESTDEFVIMVGGIVGSTGDVKSIVLNLVSSLYDTIIVGVLPIWVRPFSGVIKYLIINVILSNLIDYLINQYKTGARVAMTVHHGEVVHMMQWKAQ